jgi:hypothetical protein
MAWCLVGGLLLISILLICSTTRHYRKTYFQSAYAITNKRAIVLAGPQLADVRQTEAQVWSFYPDVLRNREVVVRKDGTGDIIFWKRWFHTASDVTDSIAIAFNNIPGVTQVDGFIEAVVRQDSGHDKTVSDEDVCRSLHCDYSVMRSDWPKEAGKRKAIVATSLIGVAFLMVVVHQLCCVCNFFGLGSDMGQFDRGIALALALSFSLGAAICLNAVRQWSNEKERRNEQKAQPPSAGDVANRAAPEK